MLYVSNYSEFSPSVGLFATLVNNQAYVLLFPTIPNLALRLGSCGTNREVGKSEEFPTIPNLALRLG